MDEHGRHPAHPGKLRVCKGLLWESPEAGTREQAAEGESGQAGSPGEEVTGSQRAGSNIDQKRTQPRGTQQAGRRQTWGGLAYPQQALLTAQWETTTGDCAERVVSMKRNSRGEQTVCREGG